MKKLFIIPILLSFLFSCTFAIKPIEKEPVPPQPYSLEELQQMAQGTGASTVRAFDHLVGNDAGALDRVDGDNIAAGDFAFTVDPDGGGDDADMYVHFFVASGSCAANNSPYIVYPASCSGDANKGYWKLTQSFTTHPTSSPTIVFRDVDATDYDDNVYFLAGCTDTGSGTEDCDISLYVQIDGTPTLVFSVDADGISGTSALLTLEALKDSQLIADNSDPTKKIRFEAGSITTGNTRTATMPDKNITMAGTGDIPGLSSGNAAPIFVLNAIDPTTDIIDIQKYFERGITVTNVVMNCTAGTSVSARLWEVDTDGDDSDAAGIDSAAWTVTCGTKFTDNSFTNAAIDDGDFLQLDVTAVSGSVTQWGITVFGYEN